MMLFARGRVVHRVRTGRFGVQLLGGVDGMTDYIEGKRPIIEAFRTGVPIQSLLIADNVQKDGLIEDILRKAKHSDVSVEKVPRHVLDAKSVRGSHQGVMAKTKPFPYIGMGELMAKSAQYAKEHNGRVLVVVLDHITDAGNLGAVSRSAEVVGASGIIIPNRRTARVEASTYKSSAGAIAHMPVAQVSNLVQAITRLQKEGFWVVGATEYAQEVIWDVNLRGKIALVVGNEHEGVSRLVLEHCDLLAKLPLEGKVASLNVAQASTACMYEWLRQNRSCGV